MYHEIGPGLRNSHHKWIFCDSVQRHISSDGAFNAVGMELVRCADLSWPEAESGRITVLVSIWIGCASSKEDSERSLLSAFWIVGINLRWILRWKDSPSSGGERWPESSQTFSSCKEVSWTDLECRTGGSAVWIYSTTNDAGVVDGRTWSQRVNDSSSSTNADIFRAINSFSAGLLLNACETTAHSLFHAVYALYRP